MGAPSAARPPTVRTWSTCGSWSLAPPRRIVEAVSFVTTDPAFLGEMTIVITIDEAPGGADVTFACENLPPGLRPQDNEAGSRLSLEQLARRFD